MSPSPEVLYALLDTNLNPKNFASPKQKTLFSPGFKVLPDEITPSPDPPRIEKPSIRPEDLEYRTRTQRPIISEDPQKSYESIKVHDEPGPEVHRQITVNVPRAIYGQPTQPHQDKAYGTSNEKMHHSRIKSHLIRPIETLRHDTTIEEPTRPPKTRPYERKHSREFPYDDRKVSNIGIIKIVGGDCQRKDWKNKLINMELP